MNLAGVHHHDVARSDALVRPGQWHRTHTIDASLHVLDALGHDVSRRGAYVAYIGSGEHPVRLRILGPDALAPGELGRRPETRLVVVDPVSAFLGGAENNNAKLRQVLSGLADLAHGEVLGGGRPVGEIRVPQLRG